MKLGDGIQYGVLIILIVAVGAMLFGQVLGQPVLLGYVETGSMEPTMEPGDGFIAVPAVFTPPPEPGDVVVFQATELHNGGLTTHRIVRRTDEGYITRGDANPFTDQDGVEPPVMESQIVAEALQVNGQVVVIRDLGTVSQIVQGPLVGTIGLIGSAIGSSGLLAGGSSAQSLVFLGVGLIIVSIVFDSVTGSRPRAKRSRRRSNYIKTTTFLFILSLLVLAPATASMVVPSGANTFNIVSSEAPNDDPLVIGVGAEATIEYRVINDGFVPILTVIEPQHPELAISRSVFTVSSRSNETTTLTVQAPDATGSYSRAIKEWRYLPVLPRSVILSLHAIHPYVAIAAIDLLLLIGTVAFGLIAVGVGPIRLRSTARNITTIQELKRRFL
ncbi:signal peptidase I [Halogeometricum borinquense]|uniref:Signal peptidase I n=1 Tax=Halogeometricum borinquense TaxID=60847 RepID=A0A6C0UIY9_9EURY|nr:signal peptidase I [Halogeometricum borinquense]QIB75504.1 signal peptidase I [Halogeometricum borinquense]